MDRQRLTITIKKKLIDKIDESIDGTRIRNRSHAIEYLLSQALKPSVTQAVILAGGQGIKLRPLTYEIPKSLIPVCGKPILEYQIEMLRNANVRNIILAIGHLGGKIKEHFGNGTKLGVKITYSEESKPLGTAGALTNCFQLLGKKIFLVIHGDSLIDIDLTEAINFHDNLKNTVATLVLSTVSDPTSYGNVLLKGSKIVDFIEKPAKKQATSHLVSTGVYVLEPTIFDYIPEKMPSMLEDIFPKLAKKGLLGGFIFAGQWFDVSTPKKYEKAIADWSKAR